MRVEYQYTKLAAEAKRTKNSDSSGTPILEGSAGRGPRVGTGFRSGARAGAGPAGLGGGTARAARASGKVGRKAAASKRRPENLPAQPWQYLARSLLAVWHESQYFVICGLLRNVVRHHGAATCSARDGDGPESRFTESAVGAAVALDIALPSEL
ncbi:hypothetical protein QTI33_23740 [Variovorax sp. J22P271]|nr:hypothetical protein [Variovorax sp. J22P271]